MKNITGKKQNILQDSEYIAMQIHQKQTEPMAFFQSRNQEKTVE